MRKAGTFLKTYFRKHSFNRNHRTTEQGVSFQHGTELQARGVGGDHGGHVGVKRGDSHRRARLRAGNRHQGEDAA